MIGSQPVAIVLKRVERSRGDDSRLPHSATELLSESPCSGDELPAAGKRRTHRRAEALGEAHAYRVEVLGVP